MNNKKLLAPLTAAILIGIASVASAATTFTKAPLSAHMRGSAVPVSTTISKAQQNDTINQIDDVREFLDREAPRLAARTSSATSSVTTNGADPGLTIPVVTGKAVLGPTGLGAAFAGLNLNTQRFSDGGNQFNIEPPDMGLAAGNGFIVQAVNDVMNIYDTAGTPLITAASLNQFFYGEHAIDRTNSPTFVFGHAITDPTVYYDHDTQRWFITVLTLDQSPTTGGLLGTDHLDIAVSQTNDPRGAWNLVQIDVTGDGDGCVAGSNPCIGDFPHVGADANGFYITTNAFPFFGGYAGVNLYALSKAGLVAGTVSGIRFYGTNYDTGDFIFSIMPAVTPIAGQYDTNNGGTEWFMSALDGGAIYDNRVSVINLMNTSALNSDPSQVGVGLKIIQTQTYGDALRSEQKAGDYPLGQINGRPEGKLDSSDARITQVVYANGKLFGSNTSRVQVGANPKVLAGASYYILKPRFTPAAGTTASIWKQGYVAVAGNNITYASIGVTQSGKGIMTFSLTGLDYYPSSAYSFVDKVTGIAGAVHVAGAGVGPQDGFTEYRSRPRWGDYSAAAYDGNSVYWSQEYIGQTCTVAQFLADKTCGGTRTSLGNWGTFVSKVTPP